METPYDFQTYSRLKRNPDAAHVGADCLVSGSEQPLYTPNTDLSSSAAFLTRNAEMRTELHKTTRVVQPNPAELDRLADHLLALGCHNRAEELSSRAYELRMCGADRQDRGVARS
jgi:hypothetical protein